MPRTAAREELSADARRALERRVFPRVRADLRAEVELPGIATTIRVYDISMSGCFLLFGSDSPPHGLEVGAEVRVSLFSPAPEYLSFRAIVARLGVKGEMPGVGVQFVGLSAEESARLEGLILEALLQEQGLPR